MKNDIDSSVCMNNIDSSVNSTNIDIQNITDVSFLDLEILSVVLNSLCCYSTCNQASVSLLENFSRKKILASALVIECYLCYYNSDIYRSKRN